MLAKTVGDPATGAKRNITLVREPPGEHDDRSTSGFGHCQKRLLVDVRWTCHAIGGAHRIELAGAGESVEQFKLAVDDLGKSAHA